MADGNDRENSSPIWTGGRRNGRGNIMAKHWFNGRQSLQPKDPDRNIHKMTPSLAVFTLSGLARKRGQVVVAAGCVATRRRKWGRGKRRKSINRAPHAHCRPTDPLIQLATSLINPFRRRFKPPKSQSHQQARAGWEHDTASFRRRFICEGTWPVWFLLDTRTQGPIGLRSARDIRRCLPERFENATNEQSRAPPRNGSRQSRARWGRLHWRRWE